MMTSSVNLQNRKRVYVDGDETGPFRSTNRVKGSWWHVDDKRLSFFVVFYFVVQIGNALIKTLFLISGGAWSAISQSLTVLLALLLVLTITPMLRKRGGYFVIGELLFALIFGASIVSGYADESTVLSYGFWAMAVCLPIAFYVSSIEDLGVLYNYFKKASYIVILSVLPTSIVISMNNAYSMSISMMMLPFALIQINEVISRRRIFNFIFAIVAVLYILVFGNRGAAVNLGFYLLCRLFASQMPFAKKSLIAAAAILCVFIIMLNSQYLTNGISLFFTQIGFDTYSIRRLLDGTWLVSTSRDTLSSYYLNLLADSPILGYGICGGWISAELYPHNGLLWLLLAFGIPLGTVLCLAFLASFGKAILTFSSSNDGRSSLLLVFCSACFSQLFVAALGINSASLYVFISLCWFCSHKREANRFGNQKLSSKIHQLRTPSIHAH